MSVVTELEIRDLVRALIAPQPRPSGSMVVDEFVLGERGRIDLACITDHFAGYELKSDLDSLGRLPRQMDVYGEVFDYCTLVVTQRHLARARELLQPSWGLALVKHDKNEHLQYRQIRRARVNRTVQKQALAELLWRDETLRVLDLLGAADGFRSKPKGVLWARLCEVTELADLRQFVTQAITARQGWRDVRAPHEDAGRSRLAGASSGFLDRRRPKRHLQSARLPG